MKIRNCKTDHNNILSIKTKRKVTNTRTPTCECLQHQHVQIACIANQIGDASPVEKARLRGPFEVLPMLDPKGAKLKPLVPSVRSDWQSS